MSCAILPGLCYLSAAVKPSSLFEESDCRFDVRRLSETNVFSREEPNYHPRSLHASESCYAVRLRVRYIMVVAKLEVELAVNAS